VDACERADGDASIGAILLDANGKAFCAGMDLSELGTTEAADIHSAQEQLFTIGARVSTPIVAAVQGAALGGGTGLVANCHVVIASDEALFGLTEIRLGLWPFLIFRAVADAIGERRTVELALTGRTFGLAEGHQLGLVHQSAGAADLGETAMQIALDLANSSPTAIRAGLTFVREIESRGREGTVEVARVHRNKVFDSADFQEGVRAFREKRPPKWPSLERAPQ
jgi:enoyl-CoA hydratase/carnithine racemase